MTHVQAMPLPDALRSSPAALLALGTAVPELRQSQEEIAEQLGAHWRLRGSLLKRWHRINDGSGIDFRHGVLPIEEVVHASTAERMRLFEQHAPPLATLAAQRAIANANIAADHITDLVIVSCTGFAAPGLDAALVATLGLQPTVRRSMIGFMGCFGAITGLRAAAGACAADENAIALVVCCELCSLHVRDDTAIDNQIAAALFADGAAAVIAGRKTQALECLGFRGEIVPFIGHLDLGHSLLLPEGRDWMTWRITDAGFAMTLAKDVPNALRSALASFVRDAAPSRPNTFIVHPGGPGILDAVDDALELCGHHGLASSRRILKRFGNMSSATVLFVLDDALANGEPLPAMMLAFGPGLTIESIGLHSDASEAGVKRILD